MRAERMGSLCGRSDKWVEGGPPRSRGQEEFRYLKSAI